MSRKYVLDTNVLIYEPDCLTMFEEHDLYIAPVTLKEITHLKSKDGEVGYSARRVKSMLDDIRNRSIGQSLLSGLSLGEGHGSLYIINGEDDSKFLEGLDKTSNDAHILSSCVYLSKHCPGDEVILVTDDIDMSLIADIMGLKVQHFKTNTVPDSALSYKGRDEILLPREQVYALRENKKIVVDSYTAKSLVVNEFLIVKDNSDFKNSVLAVYRGNGVINSLRFLNERPADVSARNAAQRFMQEAMLISAEELPLVIVKGPAGTAKTFMSMACGLEKTLNQQEYKRILVTRANVEMDASYGYLPGTESEKVGPMMRPFYDNLEKIVDPKGIQHIKDGQECPSPVQELFDRGIIRMEALQFMRGRSISNTFVIIDEAQNCTPNQMLAIVSRIGEGSKIVLIGDPNQIDNKMLNKRNNGLVFAASRFKGSKLCAQITTEKSECVRSPLAAEAAERLSPDYKVLE